MRRVGKGWPSTKQPHIFGRPEITSILKTHWEMPVIRPIWWVSWKPRLTSMDFFHWVQHGEDQWLWETRASCIQVGADCFHAFCFPLSSISCWIGLPVQPQHWSGTVSSHTAHPAPCSLTPLEMNAALSAAKKKPKKKRGKSRKEMENKLPAPFK